MLWGEMQRRDFAWLVAFQVGKISRTCGNGDGGRVEEREREALEAAIAPEPAAVRMLMGQVEGRLR